jgi:predicted oxidoreductase
LGVPYDSSPGYIRQAVETSLRRMGVDSIDLYQIHRPDFLGHPAQLAAELSSLREQGKIREVGVSNHTASQLSALQAHLPFPIATTQPEFSCIRHAALRDGVLDQCLEKRITPLAWSPLAGGALGLSREEAKDRPNGRHLVACIDVLDRMAQEQSVSRAAVALAWLMAHPAGVIPIVGTQNPERLRASLDALKVLLTRAQWNEILVAAQGEPLP